MIDRLLGIDPPATLIGWSLHFRSGWPLAILVVLILGTAIGAAALYRRELALSRRDRVALAMARAVAVSALLVMLFRPAVLARISVPVRPAVLVLVDESGSMAIRDTRKDVVSLSEAGVALGKLPYGSTELPRTVARTVRAMDLAATAMDAGLLDAAREGQDPIARALAGVRSALQAQSPAPGDDVLAGLRAIEDKQASLRRDLEAGGNHTAAAAAAQRDLAAELEQWKDQTCQADIPLSDTLKAELALVSRKDLVDGALKTSARAVVENLGRHATIRYFRFARELEETAEPWLESASMPATGDPGAGATYLGNAIDAAVDRCSGQPIAGVVVLTDGASNGGADPLDVARRLRHRGIRLVTVGVGLAQPDDASLRNLVVPDVVFSNDMVPLRVQCVASGYEKRSTALRVIVDGAEVARKTVTFSKQSQFEELPFRASRSGGTRALEVQLVPLPGEATAENNVLRRSLRVLDDKIQVLYIEGTPRWEYRYIRAVLKRDPRIDVQFINTEGDKDLARASKEHLGRFPEKEAQAFRYDLVILGDVRASAFTPTQLSLMEQLVRDRGGSLILLAGHKHAPAEYVDTPLAAMLPVRIEQDKWEEIGDDVHPVLTPVGRQSTVMTLERSEARTQALWSNVKPLHWVPPLLGPKPGAQVLAELSDTAQRARGFPLIAWHRYGAGKCMFIGTDQIWRLRARTGDKYHLKFWGQAIQFLTLSRLLGENQRVRLETGRNEYGLGEPVDLFAHALNDLYEPLSAQGFTAYVAPAGGGEQQTVALKAMPALPGMYHGLYAPKAPGRYRLSESAEGDPSAASGDPLSARPLRPGSRQAATTEFEVLATTTEQIETAMQRDLLAKMAQITGGQFLSLRDLPLLPDVIQGRPQPAAFTKDVELWDTWLILLVFVSLAAFEWGWRRKKNLA